MAKSDFWYKYQSFYGFILILLIVLSIVWWQFILVFILFIALSFIFGGIEIESDNTFSEEVFKKDIEKLYKSLKLKKSDSQGAVAEDYLLPVEGSYRGRKIELGYSYYPFSIIILEVSASVPIIGDYTFSKIDPLRDIKNPAECFGSKYKYDMDHFLIRVEMKTGIGSPTMIFANTELNKSKIPSNSLVKTGYKEFDEKFLISSGQRWIKKCLTKNIMKKILSLNLPDDKGVNFLFAKQYAVFSIFPRSIRGEELKKCLEILSDISGEIEKNFR